MILRLLPSKQISVSLPATFNLTTMRRFVADAMNMQAEANVSSIYFDFANLSFIEPEGIVVLSNTIEHFRARRVKVFFKGHLVRNLANKYLDDSGFFLHYLKKRVFDDSSPRSSTVPLVLFRADAYVPYLYYRLMPWIGREVNMSTESLETIKTCLEEVFHNIEYHSGVETGCTFAQYFPKKSRICIAISDFGVGIPHRVRTKLPQLNDAQAIRQATKEGFTTKSNVNNRGAGLPNLIRYVTQRNSGTVLIHSGKGYLSATPGPVETNITSRDMGWVYPGTLVHVVLRTDTLERLEDDVEPEVFTW